jgi:Type II CAAX prenyl endopeptidase Rce1-like
MEPVNETALPPEPPPSLPPPRPRSFPVRTFLVLAVLNLLGSAAAGPYSQTLLRQANGPGAAMAKLPAWGFMLFQVATAMFLYVPLVALGLILARSLRLGAPFLDAWSRGEPTGNRWRPVLLRAVVVGVVGGAVVLLLLTLVFEPLARAELARMGMKPPNVEHPQVWESLLASFGAGVNEESLLRLFALSLLAWLGTLGGRVDGRPRTAVLWAANLVSALGFGALHLPQAAMLMPVTPLMVAQVLLANGVLGLAFGWLYWRYGLESAMVAHFSTDIVLHVIGPLLPFGG